LGSSKNDDNAWIAGDREVTYEALAMAIFRILLWLRPESTIPNGTEIKLLPSEIASNPAFYRTTYATGAGTCIFIDSAIFHWLILFQMTGQSRSERCVLVDGGRRAGVFPHCRVGLEDPSRGNCLLEIQTESALADD